MPFVVYGMIDLEHPVILRIEGFQSKEKSLITKSNHKFEMHDSQDRSWIVYGPFIK